MEFIHKSSLNIIEARHNGVCMWTFLYLLSLATCEIFIAPEISSFFLCFNDATWLEPHGSHIEVHVNNMLVQVVCDAPIYIAM
mgnify:CR=1 FL=1